MRGLVIAVAVAGALLVGCSPPPRLPGPAPTVDPCHGRGICLIGYPCGCSGAQQTIYYDGGADDCPPPYQCFWDCPGPPSCDDAAVAEPSDGGVDGSVQ